MFISEIQIYSPGDPSVGIPDYHVSLCDCNYYPDFIVDFDNLAEDEQQQQIEEFREDLRATFEKYIDGNIQIIFDVDPQQEI